MSNLNTKKEVVPAKDNNLLINTSDRNQFLANQIFNDFDYANFSTKTQQFCKCGAKIPRDEIIFNGAKCCQFCEAKQNVEQVEKYTLSPKIHSGRKFRFQTCRKCSKSFWRLGIGLNHCQKCFEPNFIAKTVEAHIHEIRGMQ